MIDWNLLADIAKVAAALATGTGAIGALLAYRRSLRTKRAEWLGALQRQFFESDKYEKLRYILDYRIEPDYSELRDAIRRDVYHDLVPDFWRYLNFFEFIATLHNAGELTTDELAGLFGYDLSLIKTREFIAQEIASPEAQVFELPLLLSQSRRRKGREIFQDKSEASERVRDAQRNPQSPSE